MATQKKRIQSFLDDTTFTALQEFAQDQGLTLSSAVEKIIMQYLGVSNPSDFLGEQSIQQMIEDAVYRHLAKFTAPITETSSKLYRLELALAKVGIYPVGEQLGEVTNEQQDDSNKSNSFSEQQSEYIICYLVDGVLTGYWGKGTNELKCDWMLEMKYANTYQVESIVKREVTKLKKKFRQLDIRYNTIGSILKLLGQDVAEVH